MVIGEVLTKHYKNYMKIKEIQFGKNETLLDFKNKLIRCLNHLMSEEHHLDYQNCDFKIYIPQLTNRKEQIVEIINKYVRDDPQNYIIKGEEIDDDAEFVCVNL